MSKNESKEKNQNIDSFKNPNFFNALKNALRGIGMVSKKERNIKIQLVAAVLVFIVGIMFRLSYIEWGILTITIFLVLITETLNTAIENTVDMITKEYNVEAKNVKDISAGAVLFSAVASVIVGIIIFLPKILIYI